MKRNRNFKTDQPGFVGKTYQDILRDQGLELVNIQTCLSEFNGSGKVIVARPICDKRENQLSFLKSKINASR